MLQFQQSKDLLFYLAKEKADGKIIGFVPTMGALHEGHLSLIKLAKEKCDVVVCSIFVNPTQFNDPKDLEKYPRTPEKDVELLVRAGCDVLYFPSQNDVYGDGDFNLTDYDFGELDKILEGKSRPGHFKGVANVVRLLLHNVQPDKLFLGQKDFQQVLIIKRMMEIERLGVVGQETNNGVVVCPIIREKNGLAMSSRNVRLTEKQRADAAQIFASLNFIREQIRVLGETPTTIKQKALEILGAIPDSMPDYIEFRDAEIFSAVTDFSKPVVVLIAVVVGGVRLIDNMIV